MHGRARAVSPKIASTATQSCLNHGFWLLTLINSKEQSTGGNPFCFSLCIMVLFFLFFFFYDPPTLIQRCRTEPVFPRCILPSLAEAAPKVLGCCSPEQSHCLEEGPRVADCCGKLAQRMSCTVKSPLNHCFSPVPGLFLLCNAETFL